MSTPKTYTCEPCNKILNKYRQSAHEKSKYHLQCVKELKTKTLEELREEQKLLIVYNLTFLLFFCEQNKITLRKNYVNEKINRDIQIIAKCIDCDKNMVKKDFRNLVKNKNFGCEDCQPKISLEKSIATCQENFGFNNPLQNPEYLEKARKTYQEKTGYDHNKKNPECLEKSRKKYRQNFTTISKY